MSAVFRCGEAWCVFTVDAERARRREAKLGHRNEVEAEVLAGVAAGQRVIVHPPRELSEGAWVR